MSGHADPENGSADGLPQIAPDPSVHDGIAEGENIVLSPPQALGFAIERHRGGDRKTAGVIYRAILEHEPENPVALQFMGVLLCQEGDQDGAIAHLSRAVELMPQDAGAWINYGNVLVETGRGEEAIDAFKEAARLQPDNPFVYNNVAAIQRIRGHLDLAEQALRHAIALSPDYAAAWHNLGNLLLATERPEEAMTCAFKAVTLVPGGHRERKLLGMAFAFLGEREKAAEVFREWAASEPDNPVPEHHLGAFTDTPPPRASDDYVRRTFDDFAQSFDAKLETLGYRAPQLVAESLGRHPPEVSEPVILDAGCGTGLCGPLLRNRAHRLFGVDLSSGMLDRAKQRKVYDDLAEEELTAFLAARPNAFDAIVSADTLCYFGNIQGFSTAAAAALREGGRVVVTFEALGEDEETFALQYHGRYAHGGRYVDRTFADAGLQVIERRSEVLRTEQQKPVDGWLVTALKPKG